MSGNYQSRVFTFLNKQANELKNSCTKGLRHIKVAVVWSGQILFYPIHLIAQTVKNLQPQLPPPPQQKSLPTPPASDINIERVLDSLVSAGYPIEIASAAAITRETRKSNDLYKWHPESYKTALATAEDDEEDWELAAATPSRFSRVTRTKPIVRGLSSLLIDRQLVLVTTENELLDILTISQQQEIRRRIGVDLAINWQQWQTNNLPHHQHRQALAADRQRSSIVGVASRYENRTPTTPLELTAAEKSDRSPNLIDRFRNWWQELNPNLSDLELENSPESIDPTVGGASQNENRKSPAQLAPAAYSFTPQPPNSSRFLDLPQLPPIFETDLSPNPENPILATIVKLQPDWLKQWLNYYRDYLYIPAKDEDLQIIHQPAKFELIPLVQPPETIINLATPEKIKFRDVADRQQSIEQSSGKLSKQSFQNLEYQPDWIETDAETIGFDRSPVARLLAWLDKLMLQFENWLIKIWNLITNKQIEY
jgi:hypothetical protein